MSPAAVGQSLRAYASAVCAVALLQLGGCHDAFMTAVASAFIKSVPPLRGLFVLKDGPHSKTHSRFHIDLRWHFHSSQVYVGIPVASCTSLIMRSSELLARLRCKRKISLHRLRSFARRRSRTVSIDKC